MTKGKAVRQCVGLLFDDLLYYISDNILCHIAVHEDKVADAACHAEQVKDFMGSKISMLCIEDRELQCIDNAARRIDDAAG